MNYLYLTEFQVHIETKLMYLIYTHLFNIFSCFILMLGSTICIDLQFLFHFSIICAQNCSKLNGGKDEVFGIQPKGFVTNIVAFLSPPQEFFPTRIINQTIVIFYNILGLFHILHHLSE